MWSWGRPEVGSGALVGRDWAQLLGSPPPVQKPLSPQGPGPCPYSSISRGCAQQSHQGPRVQSWWSPEYLGLRVTRQGSG